jgi:hypothetical protein
MSATRFPFRFYGREPADWSPPIPAYVYELRFAREVTAAQREALHTRCAMLLAEGPAAPGDEAWWWSGDRLAVMLVKERYLDAPRMVFDRVAQLLTELHAVARLEDVVFSNAWGARSGRWDAWSVARQATPDLGAPGSDAPFAGLLRRQADPSLPPYAKAAAASQPVRARAAPSAAGTAKLALGLEQVDPLAYPPPQEEDLSAFVPYAPRAKRWDEPIPHTRPPLARVHRGAKVVGLAHLDAEGARVETAFPEDAPPTGPAATDIDGVRAVVASGNNVYDLHLGEPKPRWRMGVHLNNGTLRGVAWTCDDLWAGLAEQQLMVNDLSGAQPVYVGAVRLYGGTALHGARHGTVLVVRAGHYYVFVGVCAWQLKELGRVATTAAFSHACDGALIFAEGERRLRVTNLDAVYEAWAAPLRKRAEADRKRRFANGRAKRPPAKPHWVHVEEAAVPPWPQQAREDALRAAHLRDEDWLEVADSGDAVTVRSAVGAHWSRRAELAVHFASPEGVPLGDALSFARENGVTNLSLTPDGKHLWAVDGYAFNVHRVDVAARRAQNFGQHPFLRPNGMLVNVIAMGPEDLAALWVDALVWLRRAGDALVVVATLRVKWARGFCWDGARRRLVITSQDRHRLLVVRAADDVFTVEAKLTDAVKEAKIRDGTVYAEMTDGVWFALRGLDGDAHSPNASP